MSSSSLELEIISGSSTGDPVGVSLSSGLPGGGGGSGCVKGREEGNGRGRLLGQLETIISYHQTLPPHHLIGRNVTSQCQTC